MRTAPYGHMMTTEDAARELCRVGMLTRDEVLNLTRWLDRLPIVPKGQVMNVCPPSKLEPVLTKVWMATLHPATWTFQ